MICALCQRPGAGLRYQGPGAARWFHAACWRVTRALVEAHGESVEDYLNMRAKGGSVEIGPTACSEHAADPDHTLPLGGRHGMATPELTTGDRGSSR